MSNETEGTEPEANLFAPILPDDPQAAAVEEITGPSDPGVPVDLSETAEDRAGLARVYAELLARAGETKVERRLDATARACAMLGDVHACAPVITVTGTNGKTSTARMVDSLLSAHGLRVGRFTSPHLQSVTERISIDSAPVPAATFVRVYEEIAPVLEVIDAELAADDRPRLTFFEALTVLAFAIFADAPVEVMVLEVGMGGEWDSTNVADGVVCAFTPIALDHQAFLGDTLTEIANTKAGILDRNVADTPAPTPIAVIGSQVDEAREALEAQVAARGTDARWADVDFGVVARQKAVDGQVVHLRGRYAEYPDLFLPLHGAHQADNAAEALAIVEAFLADEDKPLNAETLGEGFSEASSPGRAEIVRTEPTILVDGAHNPAGAAVLAETLAEAFEFRDLVALVAMLNDKDPHGVLEYVHRFASRVVVTEVQSPRALSVGDLAEAAAEWFDPDDVVSRPDMNAALMTAIDLAQADGEPGVGIVVTGSLTTVAEARTLTGAKVES